MKQYEQTSCPLGIGAATLYECSNDSTRWKIPRLTVMFPAYIEERSEGLTQVNHPAESLVIQGDRVRELYDFLHNYYSP